jgi:SAM-dependent methyltransferase
VEGDDDPTVRFYAENAQTYADYWLTPSARRLGDFLALLPENAEILELGCGNGRDSGFMLERGYRVTPTDGTPELAAVAANRLGVEVRVLRFEDIEHVEAFDGIWAHACLLHVPRADLSGILARIHRALRPGGVLYASYKAGAEEGQDEFGRLYNYPSEEWLSATYEKLPWVSVSMQGGKGSGYDAKPVDWLHVTAIKP